MYSLFEQLPQDDQGVYGTTRKELIQEEFGDGIMCAIDFDTAMKRQPDRLSTATSPAGIG